MSEKISTLPLAGPLSGTEEIEVLQAGANKRLPLNTAKAFDTEVTSVTVTGTTHNETITIGEKLIKVDCATAGADVTINLPTAVGNKAKIHIQKIDAGEFKVIVDPNSAQTINDEATKEIAYQYSSMTLISDNVNWRMI